MLVTFNYSILTIINEANVSKENEEGNFIGILVVFIGALCFGSMHVPIRLYSLGNDVIFIQWIMSFGSLIVGFIINIFMGYPPFRITVTAGGMLWTIANSLAQFVIAGLGLAPALLLWSTTNILTGWSTGRFGLFGLKQKIPENELLNIFGLITIIIGGICFAFIEKSFPNNNKKQAHIFPGRHYCLNMRNSFPLFEGDRRSQRREINEPLEEETKESYCNTQYQKIKEKNGRRILQLRKSVSLDQPINTQNTSPVVCKRNSTSFMFKMNQNNFGISKRIRKWMMRNSHRLFCTSLALISGFFYSVTVIPVIYIQDNLEQFSGYPKSGLNYIFSHYFGVFIGATCIFICYSIFMKNRPVTNSQVILPSLLSGAIWGIGMICLFLSNDLLTQTVTYPILITIPGCVASIWSIFYFKEIPLNRRNLIINIIAFGLIFIGALLVFISKRSFANF